MDSIISFLSGVDVKYIYIAVAIIAILGVISLIKKAIKLGIVILLIAVVLTYGGSVLSKIEQQYQVQVKGTEISMVINEKPVNFNLLNIKEIVVQELDNGNVKLTIVTTDDNKQGTSTEVNKLVFNLLKRQADKYDIKIVEMSK